MVEEDRRGGTLTLSLLLLIPMFPLLGALSLVAGTLAGDRTDGGLIARLSAIGSLACAVGSLIAEPVWQGMPFVWMEPLSTEETWGFGAHLPRLLVWDTLSAITVTVIAFVANWAVAGDGDSSLSIQARVQRMLVLTLFGAVQTFVLIGEWTALVVLWGTIGSLATFLLLIATGPERPRVPGWIATEMVATACWFLALAGVVMAFSTTLMMVSLDPSRLAGGLERQPELVVTMVHLMLAALFVRGGLFPLGHGVRALTSHPRSAVWGLALVVPTAIYITLRLQPILTGLSEVTSLLAGVGTLAALLLGFAALATKDSAKRLGMLMSARLGLVWVGLIVQDGFSISPPLLILYGVGSVIGLSWWARQVAGLGGWLKGSPALRLMAVLMTFMTCGGWLEAEFAFDRFWPTAVTASAEATDQTSLLSTVLVLGAHGLFSLALFQTCWEQMRREDESLDDADPSLLSTCVAGVAVIAWIAADVAFAWQAGFSLLPGPMLIVTLLGAAVAWLLTVSELLRGVRLGIAEAEFEAPRLIEQGGAFVLELAAYTARLFEEGLLRRLILRSPSALFSVCRSYLFLRDEDVDAQSSGTTVVLTCLLMILLLWISS